MKKTIKNLKKYPTLQVFERDLLNQMHTALANLLADHARMFPEAHPHSTIQWDDCVEVRAAQDVLAQFDRYFSEWTPSEVKPEYFN